MATPATVTQLAARALRKLGVAVVAAANQPANTGTATSDDIITQALRDLGLNPVAQNIVPIDYTTIPIQQIAADALRMNGVNPIAEVDQPADATTIAVTEIAARGLRAVGINPIANSDQTQAITTSHTAAQIATLALQQVTVNLGGAGATDGTVFALADIASKALIFLNVYASDETPASNDTAQALSWATAFHDDVIQRGYGAWSSSAIPGAVANLYAIGIAAQLAPAYEKPADPQGYAGAMAAIKLMGLGGAAAQTFALDHVGQVHQMLIGKNLANWLITAVPDPVVEYYATLAAQEMCAAFAIPFNPAAYNGAMSGIKRFSLSGAFGQALAEDLTNAVHSMLVGLGLVNWTADAIPGRVADAYVAILERDLSFDLKDPALMSNLEQQAAAAQVQIKVMALSGEYGQTMAEAEVLKVQEQLNAENMVAWSWPEIPSAVAAYYTQMVSVQIAAQLGRPQDWKVWEQAKEQIRTVVLSGDFAIAIARQEFDNIQASLVSAGIVSWDDTAIPQGVADSYSMLLALNVAPIFRKPADAKGLAAGMEQIRRFSMLMASQALAEQVLRGLHSEWRTRNMIRWEIFDIPREAEDAYVGATASRLGPQFPEMAPGFDAKGEVKAEQMLWRIVSLPTEGRPVVACYF